MGALTSAHFFCWRVPPLPAIARNLRAFFDLCGSGLLTRERHYRKRSRMLPSDLVGLFRNCRKSSASVATVVALDFAALYSTIAYSVASANVNINSIMACAPRVPRIKLPAPQIP